MSNSSDTKGVTMNELEQRMANVRHEYAIHVDWLYEERKGEFDRLINAVKAEAWDEGAAAASPYGGAFLRSILIYNPYRDV